MLQLLVDGLALGCIYALIALGYTMVYGIVKLINFAHGEFYMTGAYAGLFTVAALKQRGLGLAEPWETVVVFLVAMLAAGLAAGVLAVIVERLAYRPLRRAPRISVLLTALGVSLFLQNAHMALDAADRGYVLETGSVVMSGEAGRLREDPGVVEAYLGGA